MEVFNIPINISCIMYHNMKWIYSEMLINLIRLQLDVCLRMLDYSQKVYFYSYLDCLMQRTAMKNFCFKDCQVFQISGCLLIFAKHFSNSCCCMTKGACKIIKRFPYSNLCIVVILFCSSITIERYFFVYLSQGC